MASLIAIWSISILMIISHSSAQRLPIHYNSTQICRGMYCNSMEALMRLNHCIMIRGNLTIALFENSKYEEMFRKKKIGGFPLREVTGFIVMYRVLGLESVGELFPNLTRIRGEDVLTNYALIIYDMPSLKEVGLYNLLKIDRGGVIIGGGDETCYVSTIDWNAIAPNSRKVLNRTAKKGTCPKYSCSNCTNCWSQSKCQRFITGPKAENCHDQCLGCNNDDSTECSVCRYYTYGGECVPRCPVDTLILQINKYCLTVEECQDLGGFVRNHICSFLCPIGYKREESTETGEPNCVQCLDCGETCSSQFLTTIDRIQAASRCVFINGSLTIHVRFIPEAMDVLRRYLGRIEEVRDYILVYGSYTITSLDFLSSLKRIRGVKQKNGAHSLLVYNMQRLQTLFTNSVTKSLKIDNGNMGVYNNPVLCMSEINKIKGLFPIKTDVVNEEGVLNGYSGLCEEASVGLIVRVKNDTSALVRFMSMDNTQVQYSLLYARIPSHHATKTVPEVCSESEWFALDVLPEDFLNTSIASIELRNLQPASNYAACIETYDPVQRVLARSLIINFTTAVGKPAPPFITELVSNSSDRVFIRWVDHKDYKKHITHHELVVVLIEIDPKDALTRNHCLHHDNYNDEVENLKFSRHAVVTIPPHEYEIPREYLCHLMSYVNITEGALAQDSFDICRSSDNYHSDCDTEWDENENNHTVGKYVTSIFLKIVQPQTGYEISGLAPYRDYRFSLRACTKTDCSRAVRGVVRTYASHDADQVTVTSASADETGFLQIQWEPPSVSNGVVLSYYVVVEPSLVYNYMPVAKCVLSDHLSLTVRSIKSTKYRVRVCSLSLGSTACGNWKEVLVQTRPTWWWAGIIVGVLLCGFSILVTRFWKFRGKYDDSMLLLDSAFIYRDSEPPSFMMSDFAPMYNIPLDDTFESYI